MLGMWEVVLIFFVILLLFGAKKLPEVAQALGKAMNEFKKAKDEVVNGPAVSSGADSKASGKDAETVYPELKNADVKDIDAGGERKNGQ